MHELGSRATTILVLDDVQWADEATLDVVGLVGRRVDGVPALVVLGYRDDELDRTHPFRMVLGALATGPAVSRLEIAPLSRDAVVQLAEPHGVDVDELFGNTAGNPFFVTEALAAGEGELPRTVRDAVLARSARLSPPAAALVDAVAVAPPSVELWLLEALAGDAVDQLDECLTSGMLTHGPGGVAFRHELARRTVEESLAPHQRLLLHRKALDALANPPTGAPDLERLSHHADAAGDGPAVLRFAPAAAARAAALGAHREAAEQYARALKYAESLAPSERAELLERSSHECYLTDQPDGALDALKSAIECHREVGDTRKEGDSLRRLGNILWCPGRTAEARETAQEAVTVLEQLPPGPELAMAYGTVASLHKDRDDSNQAVEWGKRAFELAESLDATEPLVHALNTIGSTELFMGTPGGLEKLERSLELARRADSADHVGRAFMNIVGVGTRLRTYELADRYLDEGLVYLRERGLDLWSLYLLAFRARAELDRGRWSEAVDSAGLVLQKRCISTFPRILALVVRGLVQARRGEPDAQSPLDEALAMAMPTEELARIAPVAAARAEVAWLAGDAEGVRAATDDAFELALRQGIAWPIGELACWRRRAGLDDDAPDGAAEPYAVEIAGDWARAAELWTEIGCPYEAALALADADDDGAVRRALDELQRLGAKPASEIVARRLRERQAREIAT